MAGLLDARERERLNLVEPAVNIPLWVDGWVTTPLNGVLHISYYVLIDSAPTIVARHVMHREAIRNSRATTDLALSKIVPLLNGH